MENSIEVNYGVYIVQANEKSSGFQKGAYRDGVKKRRDKPGMGLEAHFMT